MGKIKLTRRVDFLGISICRSAWGASVMLLWRVIMFRLKKQEKRVYMSNYMQSTWYNYTVFSDNHLLFLAERLRSSSRWSPTLDTLLCVAEKGEELTDTLSLAKDSSLKKSEGRTATSASGNCVPKLWYTSARTLGMLFRYLGDTISDITSHELYSICIFIKIPESLPTYTSRTSSCINLDK